MVLTKRFVCDRQALIALQGVSWEVLPALFSQERFDLSSDHQK